jgi:hypothetical protein
MRALTLLGAAALLASTVALPAQAATANSARCMHADCHGTGAPHRTVAYHHHYRSADRANRTARDVVGGAVGTAGAVAAGAVNTAGAIATAPFRGPDSYAYDNGPNDYWNHQTYAQRNGFVCTPGTYFKGDDGLRHPCQ